MILACKRCGEKYDTKGSHEHRCDDLQVVSSAISSIEDALAQSEMDDGRLVGDPRVALEESLQDLIDWQERQGR